ncbi:hypothetical protein [Glutamicibacter sp. V16R2B1]|uniref:hypothetical protein n=1 Tax=Glutamicibacter sp. V16R2B1 TaxID=2036207 RepID=UPI0010FEF74F|nr:hypothetical protein [Glutamicibacter sp. V16R2B1]TLK56301.1 hypothetical protein FDN03_02290 [Glutamicibacter sp. V16R2B1]
MPIPKADIQKAIRRYKGDPTYAPGQERNGRLICGAKKKNNDPCASSPAPGATRCGRHGGKSPRAKAAAEQRVAEAELAQKVGTLGIREKYPDVDPGQALLSEIQISHAHVQWLRAKVAEIEPDELIWGTTKTESGIGPQGPVDMTVQEAGFHTWYQLYLKEREHFAKLTTMALKAGIEARKIQLAERTGEMVAGAIQRILDGLQLTPDQSKIVPTLVPTVLRELAPTAA